MVLSRGGGDELCEHILVFEFIRRRVKKKRGTILSHISFRKTEVRARPSVLCNDVDSKGEEMADNAYWSRTC